MKKILEKLEVYEPKQEVGKPKQPCKFKISKVIVDLDDICIIQENVTFSANNYEVAIENWLKDKKLICVNIYTKQGFTIPKVIVPSMEYLDVELRNITS